MANNVSEVNEEGPIGGAGVGTDGRCGVEMGGVEGSGKVDEEGA